MCVGPKLCTDYTDYNSNTFQLFLQYKQRFSKMLLIKMVGYTGFLLTLNGGLTLKQLGTNLRVTKKSWQQKKFKIFSLDLRVYINVFAWGECF